MTVDMGEHIAPKSDQLDAVDLVGAPRTFTITRVTKGNAEQPVNVHLAEFPRPWRPSLSMRRVLVACWGANASTYEGRRVRLYCDPDVEYGGQAVGGTRIAGLSHIAKPVKVPLLVKRGRSTVVTIEPLPDEQPAPDYLADARAATTLDDVRAVWQRAKAAGHMTDDLAAALKARGDALSQPVEDEPEDGAA